MKTIWKNFSGGEAKCHFVGWVLFIICAIFFMVSSLQAHDILTFIGSAIFLLACLFFLIPMIRPGTEKEREQVQDLP
jgi:predicted membrane channel-forming protein YqfA (hemolysin III family)